MLEEKSVTIFHLYGHLSQPIDYLYMLLGTISSIGAGILMSIMAFLSSDLFSDIGNTSKSITSEKIESMMDIVRKSMNKQIKRFLLFGVLAFVCNFLNECF